MPKFMINVDVSCDPIEVEANSIEEAKEKAYDIIENDPLGTFSYHIDSVEEVKK